MATLLRTRARKPLAEGRLSLSYGMRAEVHEGDDGMFVSIIGDGDKVYTFAITNDELDRIIIFRDRSKPDFDAQRKR